MEFYYDIWNGISSLRGYENRQIGENNTFPAEYKEMMETQHNPCKFEGSRHGRLINMTALRHVMSVWDESFQFVTLLRNQFMKDRGISGKRMNLRQGYAFSKIGAAFPAYLARRKHNPIKEGELPLLESVFFTLGVGVFMVVRALMEKGDMIVLESDLVDAATVYELADSSGALVSAAGKGCAGSKKLIIDFADMAMNGTYEIKEVSPMVEYAFNSLGDFNKFYDYLFPASRLELYVKLNQYICALSLFELGFMEEELSDSENLIVGNSLDYFVQQFGRELTDPEIMNNIIQIVTVLLGELDNESIVDELFEDNFLVKDSNSHTGYRITGIKNKQDAIDRIPRITKRMYEKSVKELKSLNAALDKPNAPSITLDEMYERACGPYIQELIA